MTARAKANAHGDADGGDDAAVLRNARPDDVGAIAVVHVRSWQATYAGHFPDDFLDALDPAQRAEGWRRYFEQGLLCIPVISDTRSDRSRTSVPADPGHSASDAVVRSLGWVRSATSSFGC